MSQIVRLPQTRAEVRVAVDEIISAAKPEGWRPETKKGSRADRVHDWREAQNPDRLFLIKWLTAIAPLGAVDKSDLATRAEVALRSCTQELRFLGGKRVASLIARRRWKIASSDAA